MPANKVITTDAEIDSAIRRNNSGHELLATKSSYSRVLDVLVLELNNGRRIFFPREDLQGLQNATTKQIADVEIVGGGTGLHWKELDVDLYVPALLRGIYGNKLWMAEMGRRGGRATSTKKKIAARRNGMKGGRPKRQLTTA